MDLDKMIEKFDRQATKAAYDYQETGTTRYDTARRNAEEMASALRIAKNAKRDYSELCTLKVHISEWCKVAGSLKHCRDMPLEFRSLMENILDVGQMHGLCGRDV